MHTLPLATLTPPDDPDGDHQHVGTFEHPDADISVWLDPRPGMAAVMVECESLGEMIYLPVEVARAVAEAILAAVSPVVAWCKPCKCADVA